MTAEAYIEMAVRQRPKLKQLTVAFLHDENAADDAVQETLLRLWLLHERTATPQDFCALSVRIAKNVCISLWRKQSGHRIVTLEALDMLDHSACSDVVEEEEDRRLLQEAVDSLAPAEKRMFCLWQQDLGIQEIAAITGAKPRTVSSMLSAARVKLCKKLKQS